MIKTENPYLLLLCIALYVGTSPHHAVAEVNGNGTHTICTTSPFKTDLSLSKRFAKSYAHSQMHKYGWSKREWNSLYKLWMLESKWDWTADNRYSTAYGIAQILTTKHNTIITEQVDDGLAYIKYRYKTPTRALWHHYRTGWY